MLTRVVSVVELVHQTTKQLEVVVTQVVVELAKTSTAVVEVRSSTQALEQIE
jgi:hypothetical protein